MSQIPSLISDLAVILISAGLVTLLFKKLKQPVVLGYIVAGILAGPAIKEIPTVTDVESIRIWADIRRYRDDDVRLYHRIVARLGAHEQSFPGRNAFHVVHDNHIQGFRRYGTTQPTVCRSGVRDIGGGRLICRPVDGFAFHACRQ